MDAQDLNMSYRSRLYNHRNTQGPDLPDKKPFFSRNDRTTGLHDSFFQTKPNNTGISNGIIQTKCSSCEKEDKKNLQRKSENGTGNTSAVKINETLSKSKGSGIPLNKETRNEMESGIGAGFQNVRVHKDNDAVKMNEQLHSEAFTHGNDIYFNENKYDPGSTNGKHLLAHELTHVVQQAQNTSSQVVSRKISVENPGTNIPNPGGGGKVQTNLDTILDYVSQLCPDTAFMTSAGDIILVDSMFCFPGVQQKDGTFKSPSALSKHSVSCECLCEMIMNPLENIIVRIDDSANGNAFTDSTPTGALIRVPSPNVKTPALRGASGETLDTPHFIVFGHELCGHHWLERRGSDESENLQNAGRGGHDPAIKRENLLRQEHGLKKRGTFRDPCCGMFLSTEADLKKSSGKCGDEFEKQKNMKDTDAYECKHWREEYNKLNGTNFTTDDAIPDDEFESLPAKWRIDVYFKKDTPQSWQGLQESLTADGKNNLEVVLILLRKHPELKAQLAGNASKDKPPGDPDYNHRLAQRRAEIILKELLKEKIDRERIETFDSDCEELGDGVHNCSDEEGEPKTDALDRNVEVKMFE